MAELLKQGRDVETVFELIGDIENDITKSIAWTLKSCGSFLNGLIYRLFKLNVNPENVVISYQDYEADKGITDLQITDYQSFFIIIEAKRGLNLPGEEQLQMYAGREDFISAAVKHKAIVSMSEYSEEIAEMKLPKLQGADIKHLSWKTIVELAETAKAHAAASEKYLLNELERYIRGIMNTRDKNTNKVYVVSLSKDKVSMTDSTGKPFSCDFTWIEIVTKMHKYFCPIGGGKGGWPKTPLNYIAFRYNGRLQSIHHVESHVITDNLHTAIAEMPDVTIQENHIVYDLGPAIIPPKEIKAGKSVVRSNRVWADIDTLLTADTITEAMKITKERNE